VCDQLTYPTNKIDNYIDTQNSLSNWVTQHKLVCQPQDKYLNNFQMLLTSSILISFLVLVPLSDYFGRKIFIIFTIIGQLLIVTFMIVATNIYFLYMLFFLFGLTLPVRQFCVLIHLIEFIPGKEAYLIGYLLFADIFMSKLLSILLLLTFRTTTILLVLIIVINMILFILYTVNFVPDSVKFNLSKGRYH
jgi:hypothetical protein